MIRNPGLHRWRDAQSLVNADKIVMHGHTRTMTLPTELGNLFLQGPTDITRLRRWDNEGKSTQFCGANAQLACRGATLDISQTRSVWTGKIVCIRPGRDGGNAYKTGRFPASHSAARQSAASARRRQDAQDSWPVLPGTLCRANLRCRSATASPLPTTNVEEALLLKSTDR